MRIDTYRPLSTQEIATLERQHCKASDWNLIQVKDGFDVTRLESVSFIGSNTIGNFSASTTTSEGLVLPNGIYHATLQNCIVDDEVLIYNIERAIVNCHIEHHAVVLNCDTIACVGTSSFGCGTTVSVLNETGGREVKLCPELTAQVAYLLAFYRHDEALIQAINHAIDLQTKQHQSDTLTIGEHAQVIGCKEIRNVNIGAYANIHNATLLHNGTIVSDQSFPAEVGDNVIARDFITLWGSQITEGALLERTFVGEGSIVGKQFSAAESLIFANCQLFHGESCAIIAGPFTVSHHKSTLLIGGYYSFFNAGSGSNQSNHMYRLGASHQGICERGVKTTSDSYILWPARFGAFSLVKGRHQRHSDTSNYPFSFLIENNGNYTMKLGAALRSAGALRDERKWKKRDLRKPSHQHDIINFEMLSPYTIGKIGQSLLLLRQLDKTLGNDTTIDIKDYNVSRRGLTSGIQLYEDAISRFLAQAIIQRLKGKSFCTKTELLSLLQPSNGQQKASEWIDLNGMMTTTSVIDMLCQDIVAKQLTLNEINAELHQINSRHDEYLWEFAATLLSLSDLNAIVAILSDYPQRCHNHLAAVEHDVCKEFASNMQVGYGIDGDEKRRTADFAAVHGNSNDEPFLKDYQQEVLTSVNEAQLLLQRIQSLES
ncbi:MAG: DUF4954 family protein [Paludibacteraceae bacterium]|nr:DUF4954 family protein [Paludibacteraceae bacterium]